MIALIHQGSKENLKKTTIGVKMHKKELIFFILFILFFGWKRAIFLAYFLTMMVNFCYHNLIECLFFQNASFTSLLSVIAPPTMPACAVPPTRMQTAAADVDVPVLHASDVAL